MATNTLKASSDGEPQVRWSAWFCGWLVRGDYDREGYWITDQAGYRNTLTAAMARITDHSGQVARRIVLWRFMLEWAKPQRPSGTGDGGLRFEKGRSPLPTCQMWIGNGEDCGAPATYRVRRGPSHKFDCLFCDEHVTYYKTRPDTYVVIRLENKDSTTPVA